MGLVAEYEIGCERLPFVDVAAAVPAATLVISIVPTAEGHTPFVVRVTSGPAAAVADAFESDPFTAEYTLLGEAGETPRYKVLPAHSMEEWFEGHIDDVGVLRSLAETDAAIDRIRVTQTGWIQTGWFADMATLGEFREFWERAATFSLRRLTRESETPAEGLTDPQRRALLRAYEMGFFDIPRRASLEDIADELDISASSLSERLRRAQEHLVETTVAARPP